MYKLRFLSLILLFLMLLFSCNKNEKSKREQIIEDQMIDQYFNNKNEIIKNSINESFLINENHDLLIDYYWSISDGRNLENSSIEPIDWVGPMTPRVIFNKFEISPENTFYQVRLRKEMFYFLYQTEMEKEKLYPIGNSFGTDSFNFVFNENYSSVDRYRNDVFWGRSKRIGKQIDINFPLIGIWGELPSQNEYRLIDPIGCLYYMEIDKEIPYWAVREGTYLLKQIDDKTFITVSSFDDGLLKLEFISDKEMLLTPIFSLPDDEEGLVAQLIMHRSSVKMEEDDNESYY